MSLQDFLGDKKEIEIFDFLAENIGNSYNQSELSELTGISRVTLIKYLPRLIQNGMIDIDQSAGNIKTYRVANNQFVKLIIAAVMEHSFMQSGKLSDKEQELTKIASEISEEVYIKSRYYKPADFSCYMYEVIDDNKEMLQKSEQPQQLYEAKSA